jgi:hypothetical protein
MKLILKYPIFLLILTFNFVFFSQGNAQQIKLSAKIDSSNIIIGSQARVVFEAHTEGPISVSFPKFADSLASHVEIIQKSSVDTIRTGHSIDYRQTVIVTSFDSGSFSIPAYPFVYTTNGKSDTLLSNPLSINVSLVPTDTSKVIADVKKPFDAPITWKEIMPYVLWGLLILAVIALIIFVIVRWYKKKPLLRAKKITEPAHVIALRELDKLKDQKLWQNGFVKEYYSNLTEIIRLFIERRFEIPALEQTSDELLFEFKQKKVLESSAYDLLSDLLKLADLVKFAKHLPLPVENEKCLENGYTFVNQQTLIAPVPPVNPSEQKDINEVDETKINSQN